MPQNKNITATEGRRETGQGVPFGDTGDGDTGVPEDQQGISNRPGDQEDEDMDDDDLDVDPDADEEDEGIVGDNE